MSDFNASISVTSLGPYRLVGRIGSGGMAEVWKATVTGPGGFERLVVVKRILPHLADDERFAERFLSEARLSARLHHSNVVDVFGCGEIDGRYYLAMEFVHGHDLAHLLRAHAAEGSPPAGLAAYVMRDVCRALGYAHQLHGEDGQPLGLVHRDVSPSNIMVSYDGAVKLLDFGIAKALSELADEHTRQTGLEGKRTYLAPEVIAGHPTNALSDQYAAGIVMHETLTGSRLFKDVVDPRRAFLDIPPPSRLNPRVPEELDRICLRALAFVPGERFASCDEMADALDRVAHQLAWGSQQAAGLLRRLLPERRYAPVLGETESVPVPATRLGAEQQTLVPIELPTTPYELPPRRPLPRIVWAGTALAVGLVGVLAGMLARGGGGGDVDESRPGVSAAAPTVAATAPTTTTTTMTTMTAPPPPNAAPPAPPPPSPSPPPAEASAPPAAPLRPTPVVFTHPSRAPATVHASTTPHPKSSRHPPPRANLLKGDMLDPFNK